MRLRLRLARLLGPQEELSTGRPRERSRYSKFGVIRFRVVRSRKQTLARWRRDHDDVVSPHDEGSQGVRLPILVDLLRPLEGEVHVLVEPLQDTPDDLSALQLD